MDAGTDLYRRGGKRLFDLLVTIPALVILSPVLAVISILIRREIGAPVLSRQRRPGKDGSPFTILKFRTMSDAPDADGGPSGGTACDASPRATRLGEILRSTSLDELPELLNVIQGTMSVVGPRPLLMEYLDRYTPEQARRHEVRPGITGWAQVHGDDALEYGSRFEHDVWYVDHVSFGLDLKIIRMTVASIVRGRGAGSLAYTTGGQFLGEEGDGGTGLP